MNENIYGIDLGTCNFKVFNKATGKIMKEKTTVAIINKNQIYAYGDDAYAMHAMVEKGHNGATEFPIWRVHEELGYGILDNLELYGKFGYTHDGDIDRKGMHLGRAGLKYRAVNSMDGWTWDLYADAQLGGISAMSGSYTATGFNYDNYSNGRWGFHVGTQFGRQWSKFSTAAFVEALRTFGNDNNTIELVSFDLSAMGMGVVPAAALGFPSEISVNLKSTTEINAGLKAFYQIDDRWSIGGGFTFKHHSDNAVESIASGDVSAANPLVLEKLLENVADMEDGFDEYVVSLTGAYQLNDKMQVSVYGEYTFDESHKQSQNGTDVKAELGVRLNVQF